jgi:hypothetical protein
MTSMSYFLNESVAKSEWYVLGVRS